MATAPNLIGGHGAGNMVYMPGIGMVPAGGAGATPNPAVKPPAPELPAIEVGGPNSGMPTPPGGYTTPSFPSPQRSGIPGFNFGSYLSGRGGFEGLLPGNLPANTPPEALLGLAVAGLSGRDRFINPQSFNREFGDLNDYTFQQGRVGGVNVNDRPVSALEQFFSSQAQGAAGNPAAPGQIGGIGLRGNVGSPFEAVQRDEMLNPNLNKMSNAESSIIDQIVAQSNARSAQRGLGPASAASISQAIAPQMMQFRQNRLNNLQTALDSDRQTGLAGRGQDIQTLLGNQGNLIGQRGQDIGANANRLSQLLSGLQGEQQTSLTGRGQGLDAVLRNQGNLIGQRGNELNFRNQDVAGVRNLFQNVIGQETQRRQDTLNTLLQLTGLAMPQHMVANSSSQTSTQGGNGFGSLIGAAGNIGAAQAKAGLPIFGLF